MFVNLFEPYICTNYISNLQTVVCLDCKAAALEAVHHSADTVPAINYAASDLPGSTASISDSCLNYIWTTELQIKPQFMLSHDLTGLQCAQRLPPQVLTALHYH